jgi:hypothetical protein
MDNPEKVKGQSRMDNPEKLKGQSRMANPEKLKEKSFRVSCISQPGCKDIK